MVQSKSVFVVCVRSVICHPLLPPPPPPHKLMVQFKSLFVVYVRSAICHPPPSPPTYPPPPHSHTHTYTHTHVSERKVNKSTWECSGKLRCAMHVDFVMLQSCLWGDLQRPACSQRGEHPVCALWQFLRSRPLLDCNQCQIQYKNWKITCGPFAAEGLISCSDLSLDNFSIWDTVAAQN